MFDCGEGTQRQISCVPAITLNSIGHIFITHLHGDHVFGLPGLLSSRLAGFLNAPVEGESNVLHVYGPHGIAALVAATLGTQPLGSTAQAGRTFHVHELLTPTQKPSIAQKIRSYYGTFEFQVAGPDGTHLVLEAPSFKVSAAPLKHKVPCLGCVQRHITACIPLDCVLLSDAWLCGCCG